MNDINRMSIEELTKHFRSMGFNYYRVYGFHGGLGNVEMANGSNFHIRPDGTPAYKERYAEARIFEECVGLAGVFDSKVWFHIRADGTPAYEERFEHVHAWHEGLSLVKQDGKCFHIRPDGTAAYAERYNGATSFKGGVAWVELHHPNYRRFQIRSDGTPV
jgi:hypothetical protein